MGFDYLTSCLQSPLLFYNLLLGPVTNDAIETGDREKVMQAQNMASDDFKVVRDQYSFCPKDDINHGILIQAVERGAALKVHHNQKNQSGFYS
jgi:hypothetical protein